MRHVVHKEVMDTLQDIKEILDITHASSCTKTSNIVGTFAKGHCKYK